MAETKKNHFLCEQQIFPMNTMPIKKFFFNMDQSDISVKKDKYNIVHIVYENKRFSITFQKYVVYLILKKD